MVSTVFYYAYFGVNWKGKMGWCLGCGGYFVGELGRISENSFVR